MRGVRGLSEAGAFDLLGFPHVWGRSRKGRWVVKQQTAKGRMSRAVRTIGLWCKDQRHRPVAERHQALVVKLRNHRELQFADEVSLQAHPGLVEGTGSPLATSAVEYSRHEPESTLLHQVVRENLETFLEDRDDPIPAASRTLPSDFPECETGNSQPLSRELQADSMDVIVGPGRVRVPPTVATPAARNWGPVDQRRAPGPAG
jgi:hypothetical protein